MKNLISAVSIVLVASVIYLWGHADGSAGKHSSLLLSTALAQEGASNSEISPVKATTDRDAYFPGTEDLAPDEMRITACGTGMPNARPKQAAACWLVELGNGDKFIFDIGTGSAERLAALGIPYDYLDKVFLGHLHSDHFGDLDALWVGGVIAGRTKPLSVWGPSGSEPKYGTSYAIDHLQKYLTWDIAGRVGQTDTRGLKINVTEFDYRGENQVVYQENGVTIRSFPAIHAIDGAVSFALEWNGLKFVYSSDTYPNKWMDKFAKNADILVHEVIYTPEGWIKFMGFSPEVALQVGTQIHTSPQQFGKVMSRINPRRAVGYHFFNDFDTIKDIAPGIRETYDVPVDFAVDYMVWNVTKDDIRVRMAAINEEVWPPKRVNPQAPPDRSQAVPNSQFIIDGGLHFTDIVKKMYDDINTRYGSKAKPAY
jgi:ribonuclease Z